ncbi:uncharacterized protein LOC128161694 [Crassostrea angulata]|uniref:uncharacterized protein LOC128161694 n=1 Tax=Magallana angulata TaxID=2784310 RepID=UPI0022B2174D|nr:uncharacterized protein LOC128161694 [Crassostrea angulata]
MTPSMMQYTLFSEFGAFGFFTYEIEGAMVGNTKRNILQLNPPELYLRNSVYLYPYEDNQVARRYLDRVVPMIQRFNSHWESSSSFDDIGRDLRRKVIEVFEFERQISQAIRIAESSNEDKLLYTITDLQRNFPNINWTVALPAQQLSVDTPIQLNFPSYFTSLNGMLGKIDRSTLTMYLYVRAILTGILPYAPKATRQFMDNMYESETAQDYTWIECMGSTLKLLPEEVLVEYSTKYADRIKPVSEYVSSLAANLIDTSLRSFMAYGGYSDSTKFTVSGTLSFLSVVITPIPIITWTVTLPTSSDVLYLFRANYASQIYASRLVSRIGEVYSMPFIPWSDVDIVYDKDINTIGIPYGTLSWKTNLKPEFSFMSSVGVLLSEKITSAIYGSLDVQSPNTEWSGSSFRHFEDKQNCFSNQLFEKRTETGIDKTKRVMSGHAGLYIVIQEQKRLLQNNLIQQYQFPFLALHSEQLFYLSMIQEMCKVDKAEDILSNKLRWNTILMNDNSFIEAFKCPSDSTMNPRYKCHLFQQTNYTVPPTTVAPTTTTISTTTRPTTTTTTTTAKPTTTTTTAKPTTTTTATAKPTTTTTTTAKPTTTTTTTAKPTTTTTAKPPPTTTTTAKPTTTTTAKPKTTTTTAQPTTTTTTTAKPTTTTTTSKPTTTTTTTAKPTTTTTTAKPTTTTTAKPITTTAKPPPPPTTTTTTTVKPTTTAKPTTTTTPSPTTTTTITTTTSTTAASTQRTTTEQDTLSTTEFNPFNEDPDTEPPICQSGFCYSLAYSIYSRLDLFADPCEDFYQHACGGWVSGRNTLMELNMYNKSRNSITEDVRYDFREKLLGIVEAKVTDEDSEYLQVIKRHYEACTVSNKIRQVESVTNDMQVLLDVLGMQSDLTSYLGPPLMHSILGADFGGSGVFDYGVIQALVDQTPTFILQITPSTLYLRSDAYFLPYEDNTIAKRYLERLVPVLQTSNEQLRAPFASEDITDRLFQRLKEVFAFEQELAKALQADDVFEPYVDVSLIELEQRYPNIDWVYMLPAQQNFAVTPIRVVQPSYFQSLDQLFNVTNEDIIAMHIYIKAVLTGVLPHTPLVIRKSMEGIYGNDTSSPFSRGYCLDSVLNLLNKEIHHEYRLQYKEEIQTKTTYYLSLSQRINETLYNHITSTSDFSDITSERIRTKLTQLKFQFPEDPQISWTVSIFNTPDISFLYRANAAIQVKRYQEFDTIGIPATQSDIAWADTSIQLDSNLNVLGISYPALDFHYAVDPQIPALFTSGWQIARQMITAVMGDFTSTPAMWSTSSLDTLLEKKNCYNTQNPGVNSDDFVIGDLIAGGVSLDLITKVYSDLVSADDIQKFVLPDPSSIFSMEELIFLTFAQQMCEIDNLSGTPSGQSRVNKILQNDAAFQTAFGCPGGSSMNPDQKCHLLSSLANPLD